MSSGTPPGQASGGHATPKPSTPDADAMVPTALFSGGSSRAPSSTTSSKKMGLVKDQLTMVHQPQPDGGAKLEICHIDEDLSFDKGFFLTIRAIQLLKKHAQGKPILVGIAGPSGAGKTVFCQKLQDFMPGLCVLSMDMYNDASMLLDGNFDDPRLTDYDLLMENLGDLKAGKTIQAPVYSFKESKRVGTTTVECPESNVIIVEGIYALSDKLRPLQDLRVSISGGVHFDLVKRVMRDIDRSGQEPEDIIHQISETVYPMYKAFIEPDLRMANLRVVNSFNPFAGFQVRVRTKRKRPPLARKNPSRKNAPRAGECQLLRYLPYHAGSHGAPLTRSVASRLMTQNHRRPLFYLFVGSVFERVVANAPEDTPRNSLTSLHEPPRFCRFRPRLLLQDPTYILKSDTVVDPEKIRSVLNQDECAETKECETTDIYLLPPHEDPETCTSWLRMRNRDGHYTLMFEETVCDGDVMISPRIKFEVGVRILGGLMALGYEVGAIMKRRSREWSDELISVKIDWIEGLDRSFTQIQGKVRAAVVEAGSKLGLDGTYIPHSYIEQVQLEEMTEELRHITEEMRDKFVTAANRTYPYHANGAHHNPANPNGTQSKMMNGGIPSKMIPSIERTSSGSALLGSAPRGRRDARSESVTRLQDAVRRRRPDSRGPRPDGGGNGGNASNGSNSRGGDAEWADGNAVAPAEAADLMSPGVPGRPPLPQAMTPPYVHSPAARRPGAGGAAAYEYEYEYDRGGAGSGGSGGSSGEDDQGSRGRGRARTGPGYSASSRRRDGGGGDRGGSPARTVPRAPSPFYQAPHFAGIELGGVNRLEGRLNLLSQRVDDLAQAYGKLAMDSPRHRSPRQSDAATQEALRAEALRVRAEAANAQTVKMLAVAALGVAIGGVVTGAVFARSGR